MDLFKIAGTSIFILIASALIIYTRIRNQKRSSRKLAALNAFASEHQCTILIHDTWENTLVGISDPEKNMLFYIRSVTGMELRQVIPLHEVSKCRMVKTERKESYNREVVNVMDKIELVLSFKEHKPDISLEFYNADFDNLTLSGELQIAQKWNEMIRGRVTGNLKKKVVPMPRVIPRKAG